MVLKGVSASKTSARITFDDMLVAYSIVRLWSIQGVQSAAVVAFLPVQWRETVAASSLAAFCES